jgi:Cys-tRNA(Pro)/Cys-tRNA(Cys) deacylase
MAGTPATSALRRAGVCFIEHQYPHDPRHESYGREAAEALACDPAAIFKTLICLADHTPVVAIIPVLTTLDFRCLARAAGTKRAHLAEQSRAERLTGYRVGGISPFGQRTALQTFLDASALNCSTMFVSSGQRGWEVELAPTDLVALTKSVVCVLGRDATHRAPQR